MFAVLGASGTVSQRDQLLQPQGSLALGCGQSPAGAPWGHILYRGLGEGAASAKSRACLPGCLPRLWALDYLLYKPRR